MSALPAADRVSEFLASAHRHPLWEQQLSASGQFAARCTRLPLLHRYAFDAAAAERAATVLRECPDLIAEQLDFAVPPYPETCISLPIAPWLRGLRVPTSRTDAAEILFRIVDGQVITFTIEPNGEAGLWPFGYEVGQFVEDPDERERGSWSWDLERQLTFADRVGVSRSGIDHWLWGSTIARLDPRHHRALRERVVASLARPSLVALTEHSERWREHVRQLTTETTGTMAMLMTILLILNRPTLIRHDPRPRGRTFHRGKLKTYQEHHVVTVSTQPVVTLRAAFGRPSGPSGDHRRRHEVKGHWCQDAASRRRACEHVWQRLERDAEVASRGEETDSGRRFACPRCGGRRWWRRAHARGDAGVGFVTKDYAVTDQELMR